MNRGKGKLEKIEKLFGRQVTYSKRKNGLMKKAHQLSVLCDVQIAVVSFSPSGRLSQFSSHNKRMEEILERYANLPDYLRD
ncbi:MADS-box transcription factor 15 [Acorus calamus]|uniref:MADS-box transcription factor 15 n=1 Tax=Acorus calamus TaxID=4465 RepID=A0AAV9CN12_ACOCL|nr:MADS-box transcription factor 15 [Acorus calamus]